MARPWHKDTYWPFVLSFAGLLMAGLLFVYSASHYDPAHYEVRQLFWIVVALFFFAAGFSMGYRTFLGFARIFYGITILMLLFVLVRGHARLGAQRWIELGPLALQPSEFAKLSVLLVLADFLGGQPIWENKAKTLFGAMAVVGVPLLLILKQPDLGTALVLATMTFFMFFFWGLPYRYFIMSIVSAALATPLLWAGLKDYQKSRLLVFLNPDRDPLGAGYTAIQSKIAVGSGGLLGKGFLAGTQTQLKFVPEHHTDFIFCVFGEEMGFVGAIALLFLYGLLFQTILKILEHTTDMKAKLLALGLLSLLFAQVFINIGMSFGLMPITGITLPLFSYGGSSLVSTAFGLGMVLSIHKERSIF